MYELLGDESMACPENRGEAPNPFLFALYFFWGGVFQLDGDPPFLPPFLLPPGYRCLGEEDGCCTVENPCNAGEGDCDSSSQCMDGLECTKDACFGDTFDSTDDCCNFGKTALSKLVGIHKEIQ